MTPGAVPPLATDDTRFRRPTLAFRNARSAFRALLEATAVGSDAIVLLPSYVGWSPREGSGVFDPVRELGLPFAFYRLDDRLRIDLEDFHRQFRDQRVGTVVLIHYFGYVDPSYDEAVAIAKDAGACIVEDEAHAMLTDLIGGRSGRAGDFSFFSLHKLLPVPFGGVLVANGEPGGWWHSLHARQATDPAPDQFDLAAIAARRRDNAQLIHAALRGLVDDVTPLWGMPGPGEVPQTYPVLIRNVSRDALYFAMREEGVGVVSLYHTLIDPIATSDYPDSQWVARRIMNLPVHQDLEPEDLERTVAQLAQCIASLRRDGEGAPAAASGATAPKER